MKWTIGQTVTRFWYGEKFVFTYEGLGEWSCDNHPFPPQVFDFY